MDRIELLNAITAGRASLESALTRMTNEQMTQPDLPGGWSVKDLLAHLGWWQRRVVMIYNALKSGVRPETVLISGTIDELNEQVMAEYRSADLDVVREMEGQAYQDLLEIAETAPENELFEPHTFAWTEGRPFLDWLAGDTYEHYAEHLPVLENKLAEKAGTLRQTGETESDAEMPGQPRLNAVIARASAFIEREGREIDRVRFEFHFGTLAAQELLEQLSRYQNDDGGFHGLEVDIHAPVSNPFTTDLALQVLLWASILDSTIITAPLLERAVAYLETTQQEDGTWRFTPEVYKHSLAPWFQGWQWPNINPSCPIAGSLKRLGLGSDQLHSRVQTLFDDLATPDDLTGADFYRVMPYANYLQTEWAFPEADFYRWGVVWWIVRQTKTNPDFEPTQFFELAPLPDLAVSRRLPLLLIETQLEHLLAAQSEDGGWPTPYDPRWRPWITVNNLLILRAYGKI